MKTNASKTAADNNTTAKPFFNKSGGESLFSADTKTEQPFFTKSAIQANLSVGAPDDPYEQEAEKVSRQVMSSYDQVAGIQRKLAPFGVQSMMIQPMRLGALISRRPQTLQAKCAECDQEEQLAQPKSMGIQFAGDGAMVPADIESKIQSRRGGGSGMDAQTKSAMETSFGADFSGVKVHTDSTAVQMSQQLNAHAFTVGNDIFFNQGRYQPQTKEGAGLLSHELTHTVQQGASVQSKRINRNSLLGSLAGHEAAHLSAMSGDAPALNRQEIAQLQELPEEEMTKMQQLQMLQMKGVDEVQKKEGRMSLRRCSNPSSSAYKKGDTLGVNTKNKQGWVLGFVDNVETSLPDFLKVEYIEQKLDAGVLRDYFKISEGPFVGKTGKLKTGFLDKKSWGGPVNIIFDSTANKVNYGAGEASATMQQKPGSSAPLLPKGRTFNLMLPDHPHSGQYGDYSSVWFRIEGGPQGDEYFHRGSVSWGCISVTEDKWPTIYNHIINKRNGTKYIGTAKRI